MSVFLSARQKMLKSFAESNRSPHFVVAVSLGLAVWLIWSGPAWAQGYLNQVGSPTFSTALPLEPGLLDLSNGNQSQAISLGAFPERGNKPFAAALVYDSRIWQVVGTAWQPTNVSNSWGGWRLITSASPGTFLGSTSLYESCSYINDSGHLVTYHYWAYYNYKWAGPDGSVRTFPITTWNDTLGHCGGVQSSGNAPANDSSGFHMYVTGFSSASVLGPDGSRIFPSYKDTNGNFFSTDGSGNIIDTLGRTPVTVTSNCNGNSSQTCYDVLNSKGSTSRYTVTTTSISVSTAFGQSGVTEYSGALTVVQKVTLPDQTFYQFAYDSYGELNSITLPTLGQITYAYTNFQDSTGNRNRWLASRTSGGGTWSYTPAVISSCSVGCQQKVTVTKPSGDNAVYTFTVNNGSWSAQVQTYTGAVSPGNLLSTTVRNWNFSHACTPTPCTGNSYIQKSSETVTLPVPSGSSVSKTTQLTYDSISDMNVTAIKEWKFYSGSQPTNPDRETDITYLGGSSYLGANILNRPLSSTVKDGGGNVVAQTNFSYDDSGSLSNSTPATGIVNHDDGYGLTYTVRGNLTSVKRCTNLSACSSNYVQASMTYDTTGQVLSATDANGNVTNFSYTDTAFYNDAGDGPSNPPQPITATVHTNAYVKTLTAPITALATTFGYYYGTGQRALVTDANSQTAYSHFYDSFSRPTSAVLPDGGWNYTAYSTTQTQVDAYAGITAAFSTSGGTGIRQDETLLDNIGRVATQKLISDPEGTDIVAIAYDTTGRAKNTSHPYRTTSDSTYGLETPTYDGLNRTVKLTHQDTTYSQTLFGAAVSGTGVNLTQLCSSSTYGLGFPRLVIDEAGKRRETWTDGFGRTIEADEPDSTGALSSNTCYGYDSLGNLLQIVHGSQTRSFTYNSLSRVTSATRPESGTVCIGTYSSGVCQGNGYDASGNVITVTVPAPNQTGTTTVTITYSYDALKRLTGKTYSDNSPSVSYYYDQTSYNGLTITNGKGHQTGMSDGSGSTAWSYDAAGRVTTEKRTILGNTQTISYAYNLDGSIATVTYPSGKTVTYTVSNAQRLTAATDTANNVQFASFASYAPTGQLQGMSSGKVNGGFGGISETHNYNTSLEYTSTKATSTTGTAMDLTLNYALTGGDNGTLTSITNNVDNNRSTTFQYDPLNRISSATTQGTSGVDCWGQNFSPDPLANLNTMQVSQCAAGSLSVNVDGNNHINSDPSYAYDAAGNMTKDGGSFTYTFDDEGHLTIASGMTNGPYCYVYDGSGLRVAKKSNSNSTCSTGTVQKLYWRSLAGDALAETDANGNTINEYVFFAGRRVASRNSSGNVFYWFADQLGSTRTITDANGNLCYDAEFTPYGQEISHSERLQTTACPPSYKFTGYERDPETTAGANDTGLDYAFARYYSSRLGRFLSTDPLGGSIGDLQSHNAYAYVVNNPTNLADPSGMCSQIRDINGDFRCYGNCPQCTTGSIFGFDEFDVLFGGVARNCDFSDCPFTFNSGLISLLGLGGPDDGRCNGPLAAGCLVKQALQRALELLSNAKCAGFIAGNSLYDPAYLLGQLAAGNSQYGNIQIGPIDPIQGQSIEATTVNDGTLVQTGLFAGNPPSDASSPTVTITMNSSSLNWQYSAGNDWGVSQATRNALTLLHELGHAINFMSQGAGGSGILQDGPQVPGGMGLSQYNRIQTIVNCTPSTRS